MIEHLPDLIEAGIDSLKIEGRMKTALYVSTVVRAYRKALDDLFESREKYDSNLKWYMDEIKSTTYRPFTTGFFYGQPSSEDQIYDNNTYLKGSTYIGTTDKVEENGTFHMLQKNKFTVGEEIVIMKPDGVNIYTKVLSIIGEDGEPKESACAAKEDLTVRLETVPGTGDILRRMEA
jgi:putative protease